MNYSLVNEEPTNHYPIVRQKEEKGPYYMKLTPLSSNNTSTENEMHSPTEAIKEETYEKNKMPFQIQLYLGGFSIIGLYIIYRLIRKSNKLYI